MKLLAKFRLFCHLLLIGALCIITQSVYADTPDGFHTFASQEEYVKNAAEITGKDWLNDFVIPTFKPEGWVLTPLKGIHYYLRLDPKVDITHIKTTDSDSNPENVNRVIKLMPKEKYEMMFPKSINGPASYIHLLQSVAMLPGLFSDYKDFKSFTGLEPTEDMKKPDLIAKKILAAIMGNAVQETSNTGQGNIPTMLQKIPGTFSVLIEGADEEERKKFTDYNTQSMGPFSGYPSDTTKGPWQFVAGENLYYGRGIHQITYCMNFANISLFLYGDLRLVKYPDLLASDSILPWLTTLVYFVLPQSQYPTIAEVFDGQWDRYIETKKSTFGAEYAKRYLNQFPVCVLLINGGIECGQASLADLRTDPKEKEDVELANNNTKIRGESYHHFVEPIPVEGKELFSAVAPKCDDSLTGVQVLNVCHTISQNDEEDSSKGIYRGLQWFRSFFILAPADSAPPTLINHYSDYMVFGGKNVEILFKDPAVGSQVDPENPPIDNTAADKGEWVAQVYQGGDIVHYKGKKYKAGGYAESSDVPGESSVWKLVNL